MMGVREKGPSPGSPASTILALQHSPAFDGEGITRDTHFMTGGRYSPRPTVLLAPHLADDLRKTRLLGRGD